MQSRDFLSIEGVVLCYAGLGDAQASITQHNPLDTFFRGRDL